MQWGKEYILCMYHRTFELEDTLEVIQPNPLLSTDNYGISGSDQPATICTEEGDLDSIVQINPLTANDSLTSSLHWEQQNGFG